MPNIIRTEQELLNLFANNTSQQISAQDLRDFVVSTHVDDIVLENELSDVAFSGDYNDLINQLTETNFVTISPSSSTRNLITAANSTTIPLVVKGAGSQSVNLQEWRNNSDVALASISNTGAATAVRFISTVADGTAPFTVTSSTVVTNLNSDLLDGNHAAAFVLADSIYHNKPLYVNDAHRSGSTFTFNYNNGRQQKILLTSDISTFQTSNAISTPATIILVNDGSYDILAWQANFNFPSGSDLSLTPSGVDVLTMVYDSDDNEFYCTLTKDFGTP